MIKKVHTLAKLLQEQACCSVRRADREDRVCVKFGSDSSLHTSTSIYLWRGIFPDIVSIAGGNRALLRCRVGNRVLSASRIQAPASFGRNTPSGAPRAMTNSSCVGSSLSIPLSPGTQERAFQERVPQLGPLGSVSVIARFGSAGTKYFALCSFDRNACSQSHGRSPPSWAVPV